ncbi:MAG: hypothetical protein AB7I04_22020 [Pseudomonadales bacterium]
MFMGRRTRVAVTLAITSLSGFTQAAQFHFVALGDTAYNPAHDYPVYERLIGAINASRPAFTIHVGDTWGVMTCTEEHHRDIRGWFDKYTHPVVYTPGDNEWTDCRHGNVLAAYSRYVTGQATADDLQLLGTVTSLDGGMAGAGYADTLASLDTIRSVFFSEPKSLGGVTMPLTRQADVSDFDTMVENARWEKDGVVFATVHVPGSQNGFVINDARRAEEAIARNAANVAWIKDAFAAATAGEAAAVVIALHAGMFGDAAGGEFANRELRGGIDGPFYWIALAIRDLAQTFGKPVLLINGDFHEFVVDRPFFVSRGEAEMPQYGNVTRVQVYGAPELRAVRIDVDTDTPWVFSFSPLYLE